MGYLIIILVFQLVISYMACMFFSDFFEVSIGKWRAGLITLFSGPLTLLFVIFIISITPLKHSGAGLFDGGAALIFILCAITFPLVNCSLVWLAVKQTRRQIEE